MTAKLLLRVLDATAIACAVTAVVMLLQIGSASSGGVADCLLLALDLLQIVVATAFLVWLQDAYSNLLRLRVSMRHGSGRAIAMFFVPIANVLLPPVIVAEVWSGSAPTAKLRRIRRITREIATWWFLYIIASATYGWGLYLFSDDQHEREGTTLLSFSCAAGFLAARLTARIVRDVTARQQRLASIGVVEADEPASQSAPGWLAYLMPVSAAFEDELEEPGVREL